MTAEAYYGLTTPIKESHINMLPFTMIGGYMVGVWWVAVVVSFTLMGMETM